MNSLRMLWLSTAFLLGCGAGSGQGLDDRGLPTDSHNNGADAPEPGTLAQLQRDIFTPLCAQCHTGGGAPEGLRLDSEQASYDALVEQPSGQQPDRLRVMPGEPDASYLVAKLEGAGDIGGGQMPLGMSPLSAQRLAQVRDWIENGAARDGDGAAPTAVSLADSRPDEGEVTLRASRTLQSQTLSGGVQVYFHNGDQRWLAEPDQYTLSLENGQQLRIRWTRPDLPVTGVELVVNDPAAGSLLDENGRVPDGDRDQTEGGLFRHDITF